MLQEKRKSWQVYKDCLRDLCCRWAICEWELAVIELVRYIYRVINQQKRIWFDCYVCNMETDYHIENKRKINIPMAVSSRWGRFTFDKLSDVDRYKHRIIPQHEYTINIIQYFRALAVSWTLPLRLAIAIGNFANCKMRNAAPASRTTILSNSKQFMLR